MKKKNKSNKNNTSRNETDKKVYYKDGDYFDMDKIVGHKTDNGKLFYMVKWLYWKDDYNTWEPPEHILKQNFIIEYEENLQKRPYTEKEFEQREERINELIEKENYNWVTKDFNFSNFESTKGNLQLDNPCSIIGFVDKNHLLIEWMIRHKTGIKPQDSIVEYKRFKMKFPDLLLEYFEKHLFVRL